MKPTERVNQFFVLFEPQKQLLLGSTCVGHFLSMSIAQLCLRTCHFLPNVRCPIDGQQTFLTHLQLSIGRIALREEIEV